MGVTDDQYHTITHLGHILHVGDLVQGYDLKHATVLHDVEAMSFHGESQQPNNQHLLRKLPYEIPDILLVQKVSAEKTQSQKKRNKPKPLPTPLTVDEAVVEDEEALEWPEDEDEEEIV